jgi:circadian clock protein KaiC
MTKDYSMKGGHRHPGHASPDVLRKCRSGISGLDEITHGGLPRSRTTVVRGGPGCGKTVVQFLVGGMDDHDQPGVLLSFEETPDNLERNLSSMGMDLASLERRGQLLVEHVPLGEEVHEAGDFSLEALVARMDDAISRVGAQRVAVDSIDALFSCLAASDRLRHEMSRFFAWLDGRGVTTVVTSGVDVGSHSTDGLEAYLADWVLLLDHRVLELDDHA